MSAVGLLVRLQSDPYGLLSSLRHLQKHGNKSARNRGRRGRKQTARVVSTMIGTIIIFQGATTGAKLARVFAILAGGTLPRVNVAQHLASTSDTSSPVHVSILKSFNVRGKRSRGTNPGNAKPADLCTKHT